MSAVYARKLEEIEDKLTCMGESTKEHKDLNVLLMYVSFIYLVMLLLLVLNLNSV